MHDFLGEASRLSEQMISWRRDFHQHPELAFQEHRTANIVATELSKLGFEVQSGVGKTGVVALLEGATDGPTVLVRFDMDALPITEENNVPYCSQHKGVMHACGHDGHTAIGLGIAHIMHQLRGRIQGRIKFVFQPAEEIASGAQAMIEDGVLSDPVPEVALGLHLWNAMEVGRVGIARGPMMAGSDVFEITVHGKGGHGASPHETHDPLLAAVHIVSALQTVVSRNISPFDSVVVSVTSFNAGTTFNVIPPSAKLQGTIRTYSETVRSAVVARINDLASGVARAMGCAATVKVTRLTPPLVNNEDVTRTVQQAISPYVEPHNLIPGVKTMGAEDMAFFLQDVPGCFVFVGSANTDLGLHFPHHHPQFDFDESALILGAAVLSSAIAAYVMPG